MPPKFPKDELTGLQIKEGFYDAIQTAFSNAYEHQSPFSLIGLDIDHFLRVNEDFGHDVGDRVLVEIAEILKVNTPDESLIFRYGGDEFYLILPNTTREQAFLAAEKIRAEVEGRHQYGDATFNVTISAGVASYPVDSASSDEIQRKAFQALYHAKRLGTNQVILAYDEKMVPKTIHFTETQLERLSNLADKQEVSEARLLREALDDLIKKYTVTQFD